MEFFTYEEKEKNGQYETYEWDSTWIEHADNLSLKRVLYIGDSISCGTRRIATALTKERILFDGFGTSKGIDNPFFKDAVKLFAMQEGRRDAVLFNNGLHGWHLDDSGYRCCYEEMIKFLISEFEDTPLVILLTTHVKNAERDKIVVSRNRTAKQIADKYGLSTVDLYTVTKETPDLLSSDGVHFKLEGYNLIADKIIKSIRLIM